MRRWMRIAQLKPQQRLDDFFRGLEERKAVMASRLRAEGASACSVFGYNRVLFVYGEADDPFAGFRWEPELASRLEPWPDAQGGTEDSFPMTDIFSYGRPEELGAWRPDYVPEKRIGRLARLKPEMVASYVYYHYMRQEAMPGTGNRTFVIGYTAPYIFLYQEYPVVIRPLPPRMDARAVPADWQQAMEPHFDPWSDTAEEERIWRELAGVAIL